MKKNYIQPQTEEIRIQSSFAILSGSPTGKYSDDKESDVDKLLGHGDDFDWDE